MENKKYICCCSGGKDSTAMFLKILETKKPLDLVVICDIKEEYDWLKFNQHKIKEICEKHGIECKLLNYGGFINKKKQKITYPCSFEYILFNHYKQFPHFCCRWCTDGLKVKPMRNFMKARFGKDKNSYYQYVGFADDEIERTKLKSRIGDPTNNGIYPLIELGITEKEAYKIAIDNGFKFDTRFQRSGCGCCPLKNEKALAVDINYYPHYGNQIKEGEKKLGFKWKYNTTTNTGGTEYYEKKLKDNQKSI